MLVHLKIAVIAALCLLVFALSAEASGRHLLQPGWDDCHRGYDDWRYGGYHGEYWCGGRHWHRDGGYYYGDRYYGPGDRGGFCIGVCG